MSFSSIVSTGLVALSVLLAADTGDSTAARTSGVVLEIDGAKFTSTEVLSKNAPSIFQARNAVYEAERKAAEEFVLDYVMNRAAKKEGVTVEELLKRHSLIDEKTPSEEALRLVYEQINSQLDPYEQVRGKLIEHVKQRRMAKAKEDYVKNLRETAKVNYLLFQPRFQIATDNIPVRGNATALVKVIEFADYECPSCQQAQVTVAKLEAEYKGKIAFLYKDVPLPNHSHAQKAAEAAHCAGDQGKFWEYHDQLFATKALDVSELKDHARKLNLNAAAFDQCLADGKHAAFIRTQVDEAISFALPGTPGFFINGRFIAGAVDYSTLKQLVEEELQPMSNGGNVGGQK